MNPNTPQPSFELPTPLPIEGSESSAQKAEQNPARPEQDHMPTAAPSGMTQAQSPLPSVPLQPVQTSKPDPKTSSAPAIADDNDLIEKEWVVKAKQIVSATKDDPHTQNREISRFKADYLKKRYNKDIKLEDA